MSYIILPQKPQVDMKQTAETEILYLDLYLGHNISWLKLLWLFSDPHLNVTIIFSYVS